ncbi:hypothetical protein [Methanospirillum hungatei]|uniref:hypothetical protein n=1 Tax=Methanospirillum hungatei TaxID=2203 RepID=UPI0026F12A22|nr:hypothetical protein [Methanospirillum hungatei]MCA1915216.1 hypothetical protein [Methanospirillum hungatei]
MSPRVIDPAPARRYREKQGRISKDRARYLETLRHHPMATPYPHPARKAWRKRSEPGPWHMTHSHPHQEELGPHTNQPGPIRFPVAITLKGKRA